MRRAWHALIARVQLRFSPQSVRLAFVLDIRRLRLLHALATYGTVAAAAQALHLSGPAVSQQLAALERETGMRLVERSGRRLRLTDAGHVLVAHTRIVLDQLAMAEADLVALGTDVTGTVRITAFSSAAETLVARAWQTLHADHGTRIRLQIVTAEPEEAIPALARGGCDIVIAYSYELAPRVPPAAVERRDLLTDPVVVALPATDAAAASPGPVSLDTLAGRDWVAPRPGSTCHQMIERACGSAGFVPREVARCTDFAATLALVAAGMGVALMPGLAAGRLPDGVITRPISPGSGRDVFALTRPGGDRHPAARVVLDHLSTAAAR
jgi:DNA-binding transcriptional LysR family regulator